MGDRMPRVQCLTASGAVVRIAHHHELERLAVAGRRRHHEATAARLPLIAAMHPILIFASSIEALEFNEMPDMLQIILAAPLKPRHGASRLETLRGAAPFHLEQQLTRADPGSLTQTTFALRSSTCVTEGPATKQPSSAAAGIGPQSRPSNTKWPAAVRA